MMNTKKILYSLGFTILGMILVFLIWKKVFILILFLLMTAYLKHKIIPIKKEFILFIVSGLTGTSVESFIMLSGPWTYTYKDVANFPLWLPFLWGLAGILGISLYQGITDK